MESTRKGALVPTEEGQCGRHGNERQRCTRAARHVRTVWRAVHITFGIHGPSSINDMFTNWVLGLGHKQRKEILGECLQYAESYGLVEMISYLINL
jgi:hypothetical protein